MMNKDEDHFVKNQNLSGDFQLPEHKQKYKFSHFYIF